MRKIDRFDKYMKANDLNDNKVTVQLGLSVGVLGKSRKEKRDLSDKVVEQILNFYTDLNRVWLLTGDGPMIIDAPRTDEQENVEAYRDNKVIRYWRDIEATGGGLVSFDDIKSDYTSYVLPDFRDCTDAVNIVGESMEPLYKSGSIILLKEWTESFIDYGNPYLIITKNGNRMVKILRSVDDHPELVRCESKNPEFDPFEINKSDILRLYVVKGSISKNVM